MKTKKNLLFIHLGNVSDNAGHTARLRYELNPLSVLTRVFVLSLGGSSNRYLNNEYPRVRFDFLPIKFDGWQVLDLELLSDKILDYVRLNQIDLVVLCIEVWDLILALRAKLENKYPFCCLCHAMPFLGAPQSPLSDYSKDVDKYLRSSVPEYRREYISSHSHELIDIAKTGILVANNATVAHYLRHYLPLGKFWEQLPAVTTSPHFFGNSRIDFDFCYMARMERGKGVECLHEILKKTSILLGRKVSIAILGRADDASARQNLETLLSDNIYYTVKFFGWADDVIKIDVLNRSGCFLYPSYYDNFPTVISEAMACGLPIVMWDVLFYQLNYRGVKSVAVAPCFDTEIFAQQAVFLLAKRNILAKESVSFILEKGDLRNLVEADVALFEKIIKFHERTK